MAKLTKKTAKAGQKCVLTIKTPLYHDYNEISTPWLENNCRVAHRDNSPEVINKLMAIPNIAYKIFGTISYKDGEIPTGLDPNRIKEKRSWGIEYWGDKIYTFVYEVEHKSKSGTTVYSYITPVILDSLKNKAKISKYICGIGEINPIITLEKGTEIELTTYYDDCWGLEKREYVNFVWGGQVLLTVISGPHKGKCFTSDLNSIQGRLDTAHFEDLSAAYNEAPKYKIFYNDKPYKPKIFDSMAKVKASLMEAIGYNDKVIDLNKHFQDLAPEIGETSPEYWYQSEAKLFRNDMKNIEVYEWANRAKGKKVDFDAVKYYDELFDYVKVTAQFGSAVRELYKTHKSSGDFTTIVCFMHEEYRTTNPRYYDLTESDTIKNILKKVNIKGIKKCSKVGKTAIAFKNESDAMKLLKHLDEGTYFICDMNGAEIIEQSEHFIKNVSRIKKLERVLSDEFSLDIN